MFDKIILFIKNLSEKQILILLLLVTFGLRLYAVLMAQGIANDSTAYGFMARDFLKGNFTKGLSIPGHPLYPLLISLFSMDTAHVEIIGRCLSLSFGVFTIIPLFYLVKKTMGQKEAIFSALSYTFHPYLVTYSGMMLTEATYWGLLFLSVYFFWTGLHNGTLWKMVLSGFFLGLAYLTRPEGIGYITIYLFWIIVDGILKRSWPKKFILMGILILSTLFFVIPYVLYIHQETGQWLISKKAVDTQSYFIKKNVEEVKSGRDSKQNKTIKGDSRIIWCAITLVHQFPWVLYHYLRAYHFSLWLFLFFGLIRVRHKGIIDEWFLASLVLFHLFSLSIIPHSSIRFSVPVIPLSLFWAGAGILEMKRYVEKIKISHPEKIVFFILLVVILIQLPQSLKPERGHRAEQKKVGLWLKQNSLLDDLIMSHRPQEVFYAEREWVMFPEGISETLNSGQSYREIIDYAKAKGVRYILVDEHTPKMNPGFIESIQPTDLKPIIQRKGQISIVFEVIY